MTAAVLHVRRAGPLVTIQDAGRSGLMRFGVPSSGPMDRFAHAAANGALGRPAGSTAIEISAGGLSVTCSGTAITVAVCGGAFVTDHSGETTTAWTVRTLTPGDTLTVAAGPWGSWCYLAVAGELQARRWMGSTATHVRSDLGGGLVQTGDEIVIESAVADEARDGPIETPPTARPIRDLRVVLGPQLQWFAAGAKDALLGAPYRLTSAYDRMGVRLDGPVLALDSALAIPSSPIVRGSLQVAGDGVPTLLFADHQTTGGYPTVAAVLSDDTRRAAQLRPGDSVRFVAVDAATAVAAARAAALERARDLAIIADRPGLRARHLLGSNLIGGVVDAAGPEEAIGSATPTVAAPS